MKNRIIIIVLLLCGLTLNAQTDSKNGTEYKLKGKLINGFDGLTPSCGILAWVTVVEFEILDFSYPEYKNKRIPVIFTCPNSKMSKSFKVGEIYELTLTDQNPAKFEWTMYESTKKILNSYKNNKYWYSVR